jgi:hypothetical protein
VHEDVQIGDLLSAIAYLQYDSKILGGFLLNGRLPADRGEIIRELNKVAFLNSSFKFRYFIDKGSHFFCGLVIQAVHGITFENEVGKR